MREISTNRLSVRAVKYFGGDVQRFGIRSKHGRYELWQQPHWLPFRIAAVSSAQTAREAIIEFNAMAISAAPITPNRRMTMPTFEQRREAAELARLRTVNAELVAALEWLVNAVDESGARTVAHSSAWMHKARAALAKARY